MSSFPIGVTIDVENAFTTIAPLLEVHKMNTYFTTEVIVQIRELEGVKTGVIESMELGGKVIPFEKDAVVTFGIKGYVFPGEAYNLRSASFGGHSGKACFLELERRA